MDDYGVELDADLAEDAQLIDDAMDFAVADWERGNDWRPGCDNWLLREVA